MAEDYTTGARFRFSGEFRSASEEKLYLRSSWQDIKRITRYTLWVMAFIGVAFLTSDLLNVQDRPRLYLLLAIRLVIGTVLIVSAEVIYKAEHYFKKYQQLIFVDQIIIAAGLAWVAILRQMPPAYVGVNTILCTLLYYQFINNRFAYTVAACAILGLSAVGVTFGALDFIPSEIVASALFLGPLNVLGIAILRLMNRTKRREYLALKDARRLNRDNELLIHELQSALAEVKTLQGFLPICSKCHKIRDDKGYWERIENYIQDRTHAQFSHSLCPECTREIYSNFIKQR